MFLVRVVDPVGVGVLPVIGNRKAPSAVAQPEIESNAHRHQPREPEHGDTRQALSKQRGICRLLGGIFGWTQTPDHDVADHQCFPGRMDATGNMRTSITIRRVFHSQAEHLSTRKPAQLNGYFMGPSSGSAARRPGYALRIR